MKTEKKALGSIRDDAVQLCALAQAADILHYETSTSDEARNALSAVIDVIGEKADKILADLEQWS